MSKQSKDITAYEVVKSNRLRVVHSVNDLGQFYDIHSINENAQAGTITFGLDNHDPVTVSLGDIVTVK